ncbi:MAG: tetratricopeptide repeat protein [Acidobacteria bacterium]|nr:tetratricopeptide repeat protein [Acidobacteriota bacterium]
MNRLLLTLTLVVTFAASAFAQKAQPQPKSQEEVNAILAVQDAADPNARIAAAQKLLKDFKDTEFKEFANYMMMLSYQQLNDFENMLIFGDETLKDNPDNVGVLLQLSFAIPTRTREFDLDKEEKLAKAEDYAKRAITLIPNLAKMDPNMLDEDWLNTKKDFMSQANESLGLIDIKRENYDSAIEHLTKALELASQQTGETFYHLANAYNKSGKKDLALDAVNKSIAAGGMQMVDGKNAAEVLKQEIEGSN